MPISQIDTYETLNSVQQHGSTFTYNHGLQTAETDYDFGRAAHAATLRNEIWTYPSSGIVNLYLCPTRCTDGNTLIGLTTYTYDETAGAGHGALVATSGVPTPAGGGQRGNLTTVKQYFNLESSHHGVGLRRIPGTC